jgi:hypothetical protein
MSGLSRSWCSSGSISPFAILCGRGADVALPSPPGSNEQILGAKKQVPDAGQSDYTANVRTIGGTNEAGNIRAGDKHAAVVDRAFNFKR